MSRTVELNFESRNVLSDKEIETYMLNLYNCNIETIYARKNPDSENGISYIVKYETTQSIDEIIRDIKFLCLTLYQNAIACKVTSDDLTVKMMVSNDILNSQYQYFHDAYFTTVIDAFCDNDCSLIYGK